MRKSIATMTYWNLDRIRHHYADILKVDPFQIHFMCALDPSSNDNLRGILFGQMQTLIGDSEIVRALALRMVPPRVAAQLSDDMMALLQQLASAAYSLLFNLSAVNKETLEATFKLLIRAAVEMQERDATIVDFRALTFAAKDIVRQTALALDTSPALYLLVLNLVDRRSKHFKKAFDEVQKPDLPVETKTHLDMLISTLALSSLREQLLGFFGKSNLGAPSSILDLVVEVLVLTRELYNNSLATGYHEESVSRTISDLFSDTDPVDQNNFFVKLMDTNKMLDVSQQNLGAHAHHAQPEPRSHPSSSSSLDETDYSFAEINSYRLGQQHLEHMRQIISFQISEIVPPHYPYDDDARDIKLCQENISSHVKEHLTSAQLMELPSMNNVLPALLKLFQSVTEEQFKTIDIRFRIKDDEAIDANGVTRSVFTRAAQELNEDPSQVLIFSDENGQSLISALPPFLLLPSLPPPPSLNFGPLDY
jgi:hypothetical protein